MPCLWHVDTVVGTHDATEAVGPRAHDAVEAGADAHDVVEVVAHDAEEPLLTDIVELETAHDKVERVVAAHNKVERVVAANDADGCQWLFRRDFSFYFSAKYCGFTKKIIKN